MARFKDLPGVTAGNLFEVDPRLLQEDPGFNIRADDDDYHEGVESYVQMYLSGSRPPPLEVYKRADDVIIVVDGHRRRRAALIAIERGAEIRSVPCVNFTGNDVDRVVKMLQTGMGRGWRPLELMEGYSRLVGWGFTEAEIARKFGKSEQHVRDVLSLASADRAVHQMVKKGELSASLVINTVKQEGHKAAETLTAAVEKAKSEGKTKATAKHITQIRGGVSGRDTSRAIRELKDEIRRQVNEDGVTDETFADHAFHIDGRFLATIMQS